MAAAMPNSGRARFVIATRLRKVALVVAFGLLTSGCWPMFRYDAGHSGYNTLENSIGVGNVGLLTPVWTATTGNAIGSSPAVDKGVAYIGSDDGKLYALDATGNTNCGGSPKTCAPLWTATTGSSGS